MNNYSILPFVISLCFLSLGFLVYFKSRTNKEAAVGFLVISFVTFWWQFSWVFLFNTRDIFLAQKIAKIGHVGIALIPAAFFHYYAFLINKKKYLSLVKIFYGISIIFIFLLFTNLFIEDVNHYYWGFYPRAGVLHPFFLLYLLVATVICAFLLIQKGSEEKWSGAFGEQIKFLCVSLVIYSVASTDFFVNYGFEFYPFGVFAIFISLCVSAYTIFKYRLMDIRVVFTRAGIFVTVYTLVLGVPVWVGFKTMGNGPWLFPVALMAILATGGPFFYLAIQKRAEARILAEQRKYQDTLRQASAGMGRIRDLKKLLNLIVSVLTRVVRIEHAFIYLLDKDNQIYRLSASRRISVKDPVQSELFMEHSIVKHFNSIDLPLILEEIRQRIERQKEDALKDIGNALEELKAELAFPIFIRSELVAIVVMGKKINKSGYSEDDLAVFSILSNQASLAIENARSYEDMKKTQEQLFKADKMATIGTMADGLSHQINNRLHALGFIASDMMDTLKLRMPLFTTPELKAVADEFQYSLSRVQENVGRGGEIVQGLMKYTRKGEEGFVACNIDDIIRTSYEMAQFKIRSTDFKILKEYDPQTIAKVRGNFTQLQEVFFNLIDNAYDASVQRKTELKEEGYAGAIRVSAKEVDGLLEIVFSDNGIGVKASDKDKLFTPFFTTKATSKKGTGLGLYVIRKIIEDNHGGKVEMRSVYGQGTDMVLKLAIS